VLHWQKTRGGAPGIVGYSRAAEGPFDDALVWNARGSYGQSRAPVDDPRPAWRYDLAGFTPLAAAVDQAAFQRVEPALQEIRRRLEATYPGPLYFPFAFFTSRPLRAMQAYLVKFPAAILDAVPELAVIPRIRQSAVARPTEGPAARGRRGGSRSGGSGYLTDPVLKLALERHAVARAAALYARDYDVRDIGATRSYDLLVTRDVEEIHVEVKGSSATADSVELTGNEVDHAPTAVTHLVVVDQIEWSRLPDGLGAAEPFKQLTGRKAVWVEAVDSRLGSGDAGSPQAGTMASEAEGHLEEQVRGAVSAAAAARRCAFRP
jgi:hypothetical protein